MSSFVFLGWDHPRDARGASDRGFDEANGGYLFRLPRALGFRDERERSAVLDAIPRAEEVPAEIVGRDDFDVVSLRRLVARILWESGSGPTWSIPSPRSS